MSARYKAEAVLQEIARHENEHFITDGAWLPEIARRVTGVKDARKIAHSVRALERAGLITRDDDRVRATVRGRELDATLDRITHARGGKFVPMKDAGITGEEIFAIRAGGWL